MKIRKTLANFKFRMGVRKSFKGQPIEFVIITKEEAIRELEKRSKANERTKA